MKKPSKLRPPVGKLFAYADDEDDDNDVAPDDIFMLAEFNNKGGDKEYLYIAVSLHDGLHWNHPQKHWKKAVEDLRPYQHNLPSVPIHINKLKAEIVKQKDLNKFLFTELKKRKK